MARSVYTNIKLSIPAAFSRDYVLADRAGSGWARLAQSQNTQIQKLRGTLVDDADLENKTTNNRIYRCRVHGDGGGVSGGEPATLHVNATVGGGETMTVRAGTSLGNISLVHTPGITRAWETHGSDLLIDDTASVEYEDVTVGIFAKTGTPTMHALSIHYKRPDTDLAAGVRADGMTPHEVSRFAGEMPVSSYRLHVFHDNARRIITQRQGIIVTKAFYAATGHRPDTGNEGPLFFPAFCSPGVSQARFYLRSSYISVDGASNITISIVDLAGNVIDSHTEGSPLSSSAAWSSAIDLNLNLGSQFVRVEGTNAHIWSLSGWLKDATYPR